MEIETIRGALAGDRDAVEAFADGSRRYAVAVALRAGAQDADAEDVGQTVAGALLGRLGALREPEAWRGWVATSARRALVDLSRSRGPAVAGILPDDARPVEVEPAGVPEADPGPAVRDLPGAMRAAVVLHYFRGLTVAETAHRLGTSRNTVRGNLRTARARLAAAVARGDRLAEVVA